jgi:hypothetical protein
MTLNRGVKNVNPKYQRGKTTPATAAATGIEDLSFNLRLLKRLALYNLSLSIKVL